MLLNRHRANGGQQMKNVDGLPLLAEMGKVAADNGVTPGVADFRLVLDAVHVAVAWAQDASRPASPSRA